MGAPSNNQKKPVAGRRPQSAEDGVVGASEPPRAAALQPGRSWRPDVARRVQEMVSLEPASLPARRSPAARPEQAARR